MDHYQQQLVTYIQQQLANGASLEETIQALSQAGWEPGMVDQALQAMGIQQPSLHQPSIRTAYGSADNNLYRQPATTAQQSIGSSAPTSGDMPHKYTVFRSIADSFRAMSNNFPAYISAAVSSFLIASTALFVIIISSTAMGAAFLGGAIGSGSIVGIVIAAVIFLALFICIYSVALAFMTAAISYPLMSGAEHRQDNVLAVLLHAVKRTPKLTLANATVYLITMGPLIGLMILAILASLAIHSFASIFIVILAYIGGLAWMIVASLRYALTPYVILFEENAPIKQALYKSRHLLLQGGRWFLIKGFVLVFILALLLSAATGADINGTLQGSNSWGADIASAVLILFINNSLVMLYRNRRIIRGSAQPTENGAAENPTQTPLQQNTPAPTY